MTRLVRGVVLAMGVAVLLAGCKSPPATSKSYDLVWRDEFEGPAGQLPDPQRWYCDTGTDWGNAQLEWDTGRAANVSLDGKGNLAITCRQEDFAGQPYTSARIKTKHLFAPTYGRFEARIKLPVGQGIWPAFWLLGADVDTVGWPACGEIDIMEYRGHEPRVLHGSLHGPGFSGDNDLTRRYVLPDGGFNLGFHVFALEWNEQAITWFVDGKPYQTVTPADIPQGADWVYDHPFFIILNVAVGGHWAGDPDAATVFPQAMLVDYVRVYGAKP